MLLIIIHQQRHNDELSMRMSNCWSECLLKRPHSGLVVENFEVLILAIFIVVRIIHLYVSQTAKFSIEML